MVSLLWGPYYDDFLCVTCMELKASTEFAMTCLFQLLGVEYAASGRKALPFDQACGKLGLHVDLRQSDNRLLLVGHTDAGRSKLSEYILWGLKHISSP